MEVNTDVAGVKLVRRGPETIATVTLVVTIPPRQQPSGFELSFDVEYKDSLDSAVIEARRRLREFATALAEEAKSHLE